MAQKRKVIIVSVLVVTLGLLGAWYGISYSPNQLEILEGEVMVSMFEDGYDPSELTIRRGTKVVFVNKSEYGTWPASDLHPSHGMYSEFDSMGVVKSGEQWSFTFDKVGQWGMHDHLAPYIVGTITVVE